MRNSSHQPQVKARKLSSRAPLFCLGFTVCIISLVVACGPSGIQGLDDEAVGEQARDAGENDRITITDRSDVADRSTVVDRKAGRESMAQERAPADAGGPDNARPEAGGSEPAKPPDRPAQPEQKTQPEPSGLEPSGPEPTGPEPSGPEPSGPEPSGPDKPSQSWTYPAQPFSGKATWYAADGSGNCSFPKVSGAPMVVAMNETQYGDAAYCGACLRVKGPKGTVTVTVTDRCPGCAKNHLDLSKEAFAKLSDPSVGVIAITWQVIPCASTQPMQYFYKDGSSQWWTAIQVRRHRIPLTKVEAFKNGQWVNLPRQRYNYFLDAKGLGTQSVRLRIHALDGQMREETLPPPSSATLFTGKQQF